MMDQYRRIKARYRDAVLFFRLGDFYEMFFEDAIEVSALLDLTLTQRQGEPMCGIPYHAAKAYISRLLRHGKKIAVCEQLGEPKPGKGIVDRDVVEVVTPGTTVEEDFLEQGANNYLLAVCSLKERLCLAYLDLSTGEFRAYSRAKAEGDAEAAALAEFLRAELYRLGPREILVQQSMLENHLMAQALAEAEGLIVNRYPDWSFDVERSARELAQRFGLASLKGYGFADDAPELAAAGALLRYVDETAKTATPHLSPPLPYREDEFVGIDEGSRKNLELVRNLSDSGKAYTLLSILDATRTSPGARLLRQWILQPLHSRALIEERLDAVDFLYRDQKLLASLRDALASIRDIERLSSRVAMDKAHAKDLLALRLSIVSCMAARALLEGRGAAGLLVAPLPEGALAQVDDVAQRIESAIQDEPSILLTEGGLIRDGYDAELDRLRSLKTHSRGARSLCRGGESGFGHRRPPGEVQQDHRVLYRSIEGQGGRRSLPFHPKTIPRHGRTLYHDQAFRARERDQRGYGAHRRLGARHFPRVARSRKGGGPGHARARQSGGHPGLSSFLRVDGHRARLLAPADRGRSRPAHRRGAASRRRGPPARGQLRAQRHRAGRLGRFGGHRSRAGGGRRPP
jgi:DNA mismatch repair protein MutS